MVKNIYSILFFLLSFVVATGQKFSIAVDRMNILYVGIDNPLTIAVENYPNKSIIVKTDNGSISGGNGRYVFRSSKMGKADIILYKKSNGKLKEFGRWSYRVKLIPDPVAKVGPSAGGKIKKTILKYQQYIRAEFVGFEIDVHIPIDSFTVDIIRGDSCISKELKNYTLKFSGQLIEALAKIEPKDIVIFKDIWSTRYNGEVWSLDPISFFIID